MNETNMKRITNSNRMNERIIKMVKKRTENKTENNKLSLLIIISILIVLITLLRIVTAAPADPGHGAASISAGTFEAGNYTFPDWLNISQGLIVNVSTLYVNPYTGRVGIGTTTPLSALDVRGNVSLNSSLYVITSGNVGIGTAGPSMKLDVRGAGNFSGTVYINNATDISTFTSSLSPWTNDSYQIRIAAGYPTYVNTSNVLFVNGTSRNTRISGSLSSEAAYDPTDDSLLGYWPFIEGTGTITYDKSKYGNNGELKNVTGSCDATACPSWTTGRYGNALEFDGTADYVNIPDISLGKNKTFAAWIVNKDTSERHIIGTNNLQFYKSSTSLYVYLSGSCLASAALPGTNRWIFVVYAENDTNSSLYVDGVLKGISASCTSATTAQIIGSQSTGIATRSWNGTLDEVRIYNGTLSPEQIRDQYLKGFGSHGTLVSEDFSYKNTAGTTQLYVNGTSGNVGIGTTTPSAPFHISDGTASGISSTPAGYAAALITDNTIPLLYFEDTSATSGQRVMRLEHDGGVFRIGSMNDAATAWVTQNIFNVRYDGNVGIGTTGPNAKLAISDGSTLHAPSLIHTNWGTFGFSSSAAVMAMGVDSNSPYGGWIQMHDTASDVTTYPLLLNPNGGNVGIGTSSPTAKLDVAGNINITSGNLTVGGNFIKDSASAKRIEFSSGNVVIHLGS